MDNFDLKKYLAESKLNENDIEMTSVDILAKALENVWNMGKNNNPIDFQETAKSIKNDIDDNLDIRISDRAYRDDL